MNDKIRIYLALSEQIARWAKMAAAQRGTTMSEYVGTLIRQDCQVSGIAALDLQGEKAVRHDQ